MNMVLRFFLFCGLLLYFYLILLFLKRKSLNLKYSLLWIFSGVLMLVFILFPTLINWAARLLGVAAPMNTIFALGLFFTMMILMSITAIVSKLNDRIKRLIQANALLERRIRELEKK